jgi:hypothetical protein
MIDIADNKEPLKALYNKALKESDKNIVIKHTALSCLHEMISKIGQSDANNFYKEAFENALKENDPKINDRLVKNFHKVVEALFQKNYEEETKDMSKDGKTPKDKDAKEPVPLGTSLLGPIISLGENTTNANHWRVEQMYLENLQKCVFFFEPKELNEKYIPYIFGRMVKGMYEIKQVAQEHVVSFLYENHITSITNSIIKKLQTDFQASTNY